MKKMRAMAAILAAATILSAGGMTAMAADYDAAAVSEAQVMAIQEEIASDAEIQSEIAAIADEVATSPQEFDFDGMVVGEEANLTGTAYKVDLSKVSMANSSFEETTTSTIEVKEEGYYFTLYAKSFKYSGYTAEPKSVNVTYYNAAGSEETISASMVKSGAEYVISFMIPSDAKGMAPSGIAANYTNMIKVKMTTTLEDSWLGGLFPEAMKNPTFFYAFDVA